MTPMIWPIFSAEACYVGHGGNRLAGDLAAVLGGLSGIPQRSFRPRASRAAFSLTRSTMAVSEARVSPSASDCSCAPATNPPVWPASACGRGFHHGRLIRQADDLLLQDVERAVQLPVPAVGRQRKRQAACERKDRPGQAPGSHRRRAQALRLRPPCAARRAGADGCGAVR